MRKKNMSFLTAVLLYNGLRSQKRDSTQLKTDEIKELIKGKTILKSKFGINSPANSTGYTIRGMAILHNVSMN